MITDFILVLAYTLFAIGHYRASLRNGFKPEATLYMRWNCRLSIAARAVIWPYLIGFNLSKPRQTVSVSG